MRSSENNSGLSCASEVREVVGQDGASTSRKFVFWLLAGMLSVVCVEVPAGSTMFPFFTIWGVLVVWPLYLLHSVFFAGVVFRFGKPGFWALYAAGMIYGMYEAYITKVVWTSFRAEGPIVSFGGIALCETIILVLFLHALLAFIVPLFFTEMLLTNSDEVFRGLPQWVRGAVSRSPGTWLGALMVMLGLMQFVNSPSATHSMVSGLGNGAVIGVAVYWWRRTGGAAYSLRELLPNNSQLKKFGWVLLGWYVFWGIAIKPKAIPGVLHGQLTVWLIYAGLITIFYGCLVRSRRAVDDGCEEQPKFSWRGFLFCFGLATVVTTLARLFLHDFANVQFGVFFSFYMIAGFALLIGAIGYVVKKGEKAPSTNI